MSIYFNEDFEDIVDTIKSKVDDLQEKYDDLQRDYDALKEEKENLECELDCASKEYNIDSELLDLVDQKFDLGTYLKLIEVIKPVLKENGYKYEV